MKLNDKHWLINTPIAHRGLHNDDIPENSMAAYFNAAQKGYAIETDIRFTNDGEIVTFHDDTLIRMTGKEGNVIDYTYEELKELNLGNSQEKIPLFKDFLRELEGKTPLLIEIKDQPERKDLTEKALELLKDFKGEYALQSFNPFYVRKVKKLSPDTVVGQLAAKKAVDSRLKNFILRHFIMNIGAKPDFISFCVDDLPYSPAKKKNCRLICWTVRSLEDKAHAEKYAENYIFENLLP